MKFNTLFNNISAISWQSVLLVEETGIPRENYMYNIEINFVSQLTEGHGFPLVQVFWFHINQYIEYAAIIYK